MVTVITIYWILVKQQATQLTEGAGDNTFGGFISTDEKSFFYVKNELHLMKVDLETLARERDLYR